MKSNERGLKTIIFTHLESLLSYYYKHIINIELENATNHKSSDKEQSPMSITMIGLILLLKWKSYGDLKKIHHQVSKMITQMSGRIHHTEVTGFGGGWMTEFS